MSSHLATLFPPAKRLRLPLSRDQLMLLMAAINQLFLGVDIYMAHLISGDIKPNEWIPVIFGIVASVVILLAGVIALRNRPLATILANIVFAGSILVGAIGAYFHLSRTILLGPGAEGAGQAVWALIWAPPFLGPVYFILVGALGISAAWIEIPPGSGRLRLLGKRHIQMPYSKTRAYFFIVSMFILGTLISSLLDHARLELSDVRVWIPITVGIYGVVVSLLLGIIKQPTRGDLMAYTAGMVLLIVTGLVGFLFHVDTNLIPRGTVVVERFVRGSPLLAPLVFSNVGLLGLLVLLDPSERGIGETEPGE